MGTLLSHESKGPSPLLVPSLASIVDRYDGFLVDQWGVMHNGIEAVPGAPSCLQELHRLGKKLVILSNSPSSEKATLEALKPLGFNPDYFEAAVTSGMLAANHIRESYPKKRVLFLGWKHPAAPSAVEFLERCGSIELITLKAFLESKTREADAILVQGNEIVLGPREDSTTNATHSMESLGDFVISGNTTDHIDPILRKGVDQGIPLVCVDPDFVTVNPDGTEYQMPGAVAKRYEELGGRSVYFGKPYRPCFEDGLKQLQEVGIAPEKVAMIGDSLLHDVTGANTLGIDSILILGGVHRNDLEKDQNGEPLADQSKLQELFEKHGQRPTIVAPLLKY